MTSITPLPGLHYGIPFEDYAAWDAVNFSRLKPIRSTPSKCRWEMDHPKETTPAMAMGSALHVAVLEPGRFDEMFYFCPPLDLRTKEGKQDFEEHKKLAKGRHIIRRGLKEDESLVDQMDDLHMMALAIHKSKAAAPFLNGSGQNEVSALWRDEETGLLCKARMDRLIEHFPMWDCPVILELKSTKDADDWSFGKDCHSMGYAAQGGGYRHGLKVITGKTAAHVIIAVENTAPHDLKVHMLRDESLQTGYLQYRSMLNRYADCVKTGSWPGYPDVVNELSLPKYAEAGNG